MSDELHAALADARERSAMIRWLDMSVAPGPLFRLRFHERHIGNPLIRALHGGVVSAFLESAATLTAVAEGGSVRTISTHINFLRGAVDRDMIGRVTVARRGRRIAFLEASGWQTDESEPVARAAIALRVLADDGPPAPRAD